MVVFASGEVPRTRAGLDWLQLAEWVGVEDERQWTWFWGALAEKKKAAIEAKAPVEWNVGGFRLMVEPRGDFRMGFSFLCGLWRVDASERETGKESAFPNFKITVSGTDLLNNSPDLLVAYWREFVTEIGGVVRRETVSRADLCCDIGVSIGHWVELFNRGCVVTKAHTLRPYLRLKGREVETLNFGRGDVQLRIYDKATELRAKGEPHISRAISDLVGPEFSRVEYQLRREALGDRFGVEDYNSLVERSRQIAKYCARDWFRFVESHNSGDQQQRLRSEGAWYEVSDALENCLSGPEREKTIDAKLTRADLGQIVAQMIGLACRVAGQGSDQRLTSVREVLVEAFAKASAFLATQPEEKRAEFFSRYYVHYQLQNMRRGMSASCPGDDDLAARAAFYSAVRELAEFLPEDKNDPLKRPKDELTDFDRFLRKFG